MVLSRAQCRSGGTGLSLTDEYLGRFLNRGREWRGWSCLPLSFLLAIQPDQVWQPHSTWYPFVQSSEENGRSVSPFLKSRIICRNDVTCGQTGPLHVSIELFTGKPLNRHNIIRFNILACMICMVYGGLIWNHLRFYVIIHKGFLAKLLAPPIWQVKFFNKKNPGLHRSLCTYKRDSQLSVDQHLFIFT